MRTREQLLQGASQIKLTAGGGVASPFSPLDVVTFTEPSFAQPSKRLRIGAPYVATHAYTPVSIQRSIAAGVKCIEHGHLMDEETAKLMAEKGIWLSTQPFLDEEGEGGAQQLGASEQAKMKQVIEGTDNVYRLAKKYHLKTAFGTDILFSAREAEQQGNRLTGTFVGTHPPKRWSWRRQQMPSYLLCPVSAIHTQASLASLRRAPWPISWWWMAIHLRNSILSETPAGISM